LGFLDREHTPLVSGGSVDEANRSDRYRFDLESQCDVTLVLANLSANASLSLQDAEGRILASKNKKKTKKETIKKLLPPGEYRAVVEWADSRPASYTLEASAVFKVDDVIATGKFTVQDPEYDSVSLQAAWREGTSLYVTDIDPETGFFKMADRHLIDTGLAAVEEVVNGPEWSSIKDGRPRLIYTKSNGGRWSISQAREESDGTWDTDVVVSSRPDDSSVELEQPNLLARIRNWFIDLVPDTEDGYRPIGCQDSDDASPLMKYTIGTRQNRDQANAWMELDPPYSGDRLPEGAQAGRFVPGQFSIVYSREIDGFLQLIWHDLRTKEETVLTDSPIHKVLPFAINAPEFGGEVLITAPETGNINERGYFTSIGVYREVNGVWTLIKRITSSSKKLRGVHSAEPFVFDGRSYVSFLVLNAIDRESGARKDNAEVWIASLDPEDNLLRKVSGIARIKRSDPESLVTENEVFIYYTEIAKKSHKQHRTRTGLTKR
jgi:hypothetical protein